MEEEQVDFSWGRDCVNQVFGSREICEKDLLNGRVLYVVFMDLDKTYVIRLIEMRYCRYVVLWGRWEAAQRCEKSLYKEVRHR